uniref:Inner membrane protein YgaP-like transmembrane domain-containing protein n=1 Tax=Dechloromonas aromatica (strain RCB) TaxID=159087 RepID=Q479U7_DECAR
MENLARSASPGGIVPLATGLMGWCPAYTLLGIKTCPTQK